jgi:hypothetical protein
MVRACVLPYLAGVRPATDQPDPPGLRQELGSLAVVGRDRSGERARGWFNQDDFRQAQPLGMTPSGWPSFAATSRV